MSELADILDSVWIYLRRFLVLTDTQLDTGAVWTAHTYVAWTSRATPYLHFRSPEPGSGKTTALEVFGTIVKDGIGADDLTGPSLFRLVSERKPTLLYDEVDGVFAKKNSDGAEDIRKVLCSGYRQDKVVWRVNKQTHKLEEFDPFCPKALAGIGPLPGTLAHRAIAIEMQPPRPDDEYEDFDLDDVEYDSVAIRDELAAWAYGAEPALRNPALKPAKLPELDARSNEIWRVLFRIADLAGGDWPKRIRAAAAELSGEVSQTGRASTRIRLLASIRVVFPDDDRIVCQELANALNSLEEEAWGGWNDGSGITTREIGKHLSHFHVIARKWRDGNRTVRGYEREQFTDLWARYLPVSGLSNRHTATTRMDSGITTDRKPPQNEDVAGSEIDENPHEYSDVAVVAVSERENSERALIEEVFELVEEGVLIPLTWECPCGQEQPNQNSTLTPVQTIVSVREPQCHFCGREQRPEWRRSVPKESGV